MEPSDSEPRTIADLTRIGMQKASAAARTYAMSGAGNETTVARNEQAFRAIALRSRVLRDVSTVDVTTSILGCHLDLPVMLAPVGSIAQFHRDGAAAVAKAATECGTYMFVGTLSSPAYTDVVSASGRPQMFQLTVGGDRNWTKALIDRLLDAGCNALCVTVDSPGGGRRDRLLAKRVDFRLERVGEPPSLAGLGRDHSFQATFSWRDFENLRNDWPQPLALKGVMHADDARRAVDLGADAIYVSNHGGRALDDALSTIEVLEEISEAVAGQAEVIMDGGVRKGTDVIKALALGADAVLVGRPQCWALSAYGSRGVSMYLGMLREEISTSLANMGHASLDELSPLSVRRGSAGQSSFYGSLNLSADPVHPD